MKINLLPFLLLIPFLDYSLAAELRIIPPSGAELKGQIKSINDVSGRALNYLDIEIAGSGKYKRYFCRYRAGAHQNYSATDIRMLAEKANTEILCNSFEARVSDQDVVYESSSIQVNQTFPQK